MLSSDYLQRIVENFLTFVQLVDFGSFDSHLVLLILAPLRLFDGPVTSILMFDQGL